MRRSREPRWASWSTPAAARRSTNGCPAPKLRRLVAILRTELGNPSLPVVFGEIAHWNWTNRAEGTAPFNAMLRSLRIPHTACVSAEGLAPMKDETDPHFSAASQRELGRRYAEALLKIR